MAPIRDHAIAREGWEPYVKCLDQTHLPSVQMTNDFGALEDVVMVGYPNGIADLANNFPVVRRGITSTPFTANYQGKREFLVDIAVFGGSSGSPIFLFNEGSYATASGIALGHRFALIGVLYSFHSQTTSGQIVVEPVPTSLAPIAKVNQSLNLGLCIKSALIEDLASQIPGW